jgi:hypothetical protein
VQLDDIIIFLIIAGSIVTSIIRSIGEQNKKRPPQQGQRPPQSGGRGQTSQSEQTSQSGQSQSGQNLQGDLQKRLEEARRRVQQAMESQTGRAGEGEIGRAPAPPPLISGTLEGQTRERGTLEGTSLEGQTQRRGTLESSGGLLQEQDYTLKRQPLKREELRRERLEDTLMRGEKNVFRPVDTAYRTPSDFQQQVTTVQPFMTETMRQRQRSVAEATTVERKRQRTPTTAPKHAKISGSELLSPEMLTEKELLRGFLWQQILSEPRAKTGYKRPQLRTYLTPKARAESEG